MSGVADELHRLISQHGPISVAQYIEVSNTHYYATRDPLGASGDFVTSPEISQMFGELLGLRSLVQWRKMGSPDPVYVVEAGPGRGTLMADFMRAASQDPNFVKAAQVYLIEASPVLRQVQKKNVLFNPTWCDRLDEVPEGPILFVANEFFDALPICQFEKTSNGWCERMVALNGDEFNFALSEDVVSGTFPDSEIGAIFETCPIGVEIAVNLGDRINRYGGGALIVDYGYTDTASGDTFQAVKDHQYQSVLANPGNVDLTAHVNFENLVQAISQGNVKTEALQTQRDFLRDMGILDRAEMLADGATSAQVEDIGSALKRLIGEKEMGNLFKVLVATNEI
jgi:NADH dehydrogenase [ubiquinone] 1 alpha subcomplex assembly factor 7